MPVWLQWTIIIALVIILYLAYIHNYLRSLRISRVQIGMNEKQVKRLLGKPDKVHKHGNEITYCYKFRYSNRLSAATTITARVLFNKGAVYRVSSSGRNF